VALVAALPVDNDAVGGEVRDVALGIADIEPEGVVRDQVDYFETVFGGQRACYRRYLPGAGLV
jgi:hypothetical protein